MATTTPSWAPSTYKVSGGGLFDNVDSTILSYRITGDEVPDNYKGDGTGTMPFFLVVDHQIDGVEGVNTEWFSMGNKARENFEISEGGQSLRPLFEGAQINGGCNAALFIASFINAGAPESLFQREDISLPIVGMGVHLERVPDTRETSKKKDSKYPPTVLAVTRFSEATKAQWAGGKKAATAKAVAAPAKTAAKAAPAKAAPAVVAAAPAGDVNEIAQGIVLEILAENDGTFNRAKMIVPVSKKITSLDAEVKDAVRKLAYSPEFLTGEGLGWTYDAKSQQITLE